MGKAPVYKRIKIAAAAAFISFLPVRSVPMARRRLSAAAAIGGGVVPNPTETARARVTAKNVDLLSGFLSRSFCYKERFCLSIDLFLLNLGH
jgi:hypothetical protein